MINKEKLCVRLCLSLLQAFAQKNLYKCYPSHGDTWLENCDDSKSTMVGGQELDENLDWWILPPKKIYGDQDSNKNDGLSSKLKQWELVGILITTRQNTTRTLVVNVERTLMLIIPLMLWVQKTCWLGTFHVDPFMGHTMLLIPTYLPSLWNTLCLLSFFFLCKLSKIHRGTNCHFCCGFSMMQMVCVGSRIDFDVALVMYT